MVRTRIAGNVRLFKAAVAPVFHGLVKSVIFPASVVIVLTIPSVDIMDTVGNIAAGGYQLLENLATMIRTVGVTIWYVVTFALGRASVIIHRRLLLFWLY